MKTRIKQFLRRLIFTQKELADLQRSHEARALEALAAVASQKAINRARVLMALSPIERQLVEALEKPYRWQADEPLTPAEGEQLKAFLGSPMGMKIDVCMVNWAQQQAQCALGAPADQIQNASGFARGCMAAWQMTKTLSRLAAAQGGKSEPDAPTAAAELEHFQP
jgi:hypothetical protein